MYDKSIDNKNKNLFGALQRLLRQPVLLNEPMSAHTTWRIGGPADFMVCPSSEDELISLMRFIHGNGLRWTVIGNGSNLLVSDKGIRGIVIRLGAEYSDCVWTENGVTAMAGAMLTPIALAAAKRGLTGIEFLAGIPGSIGGALRMNAGAYGDSIGRYVTKATLIEYNGSIRELNSDEMSFAYRDSSIASLPAIVSRVELTLACGDREGSETRIKELLALRASKQPLEYPSCGSVFKNPLGDHAGRLIEAAGLRGTRIGQAQVSEKHGNFIVNLGGASAEDVHALIDLVRGRIREEFGIDLATEVRLTE